MLITKEHILKAVAEMSVIDIVELVAMMENKFGVSAVPTYIAPSNEKVETIEEKTEFDVILNSIGVNKIAVIKSVRSITNLGLKEAKDLVESAPVIIKEKINIDDATLIKKTLETSGATVEVK